MSILRHIGWLATIVVLYPTLVANSATVMLKNGVILEGSTQKVPGIGDNPLQQKGDPNVAVRPVLFIGDGIRRVFVPNSQLQDFDPAGGETLEKIEISQRVARDSPSIGGVGSIFGVTPFNQFGRRRITIRTAKGQRHIVQGITKLTPRYAQVEAVLGKNSVTWDMRIATSSIPRDQLSAILRHRFRHEGPEGRLATVRLLTGADRYSEALLELEEGMKEFPAELGKFENLKQILRSNKSDQLIREILLRREAGQHARVNALLNSFPNDETEETRQQVRELLGEYANQLGQINTVKEQIPKLLAAINESDQGTLKSICDEIIAELNLNNRNRLADYLRLAADQPADQKLSLIISGWLLGSGSANENLSTSSSLPQVRDLVIKYLQTAADEGQQRTLLIQQIEALEGGNPATLAKIIALIRPPREVEVIEKLKAETEGEPQPNRIAGYFQFNKEQDGAAYEIQLPPEYDSHRRYPTIVTLNAGWSSPTNQLEWWAGGYDSERGTRLGQATRQGYIVIAPHWHRKGQRQFEFSPDEHAAVLRSVRHAIKRFAIDTDQLFLSGHAMGGDAAWDIGLAHPDLWAGLIPIVAQNNSGAPSAPQFVAKYWQNASNLPMYFVCGELDGDKLIRNGGIFDRYVKKHFDLMVVEYRGRGHDHFQDDIQNIFSWMDRQKREFNQKEFEAVSMRQWDNFFWTLELANFPARAMASHVVWSPKVKPANISARITNTNNIFISTGGASKATLWLSPEFATLGQTLTINANGRRQRHLAEANVRDMLDDVRTRGDRMHPFWTKIELETGRRR